MEIAEIKVSFAPITANRAIISNSMDAYHAFSSIWDHDTIELQEEFKVLYLNRSMRILGAYHHTRGGINQTIADTRLIFSIGMKCNACSLIVAHNHPSGNLKPSKSDEKLTKRLIEIGQLVEIPLNDHLIITKAGFYSFADQGLI
ncbi:MAG: JAB domain-containing protein [Vicingaceae bacterium]